MVVFEHPYTFM